MPDRFLRTFGATAVLVGIAIAALIQFANAEPPTPIEIVEDSLAADDPTTTGAGASSTTTIELSDDPFVYKIGILQGPSTENFWNYNAASTSVWDAYVLAPTKAGLFRLDSETWQLAPELSAEVVEPVWNAEGWRVDVTTRGDMQWSDGTAVTAYDYAFTFETVRRLQLGGNWAKSFPVTVTSVEAADNYHLTIRFSERPSLEAWPYSLGTAPIMARDFWAESAGAATTAAELFALDGSDDVAGGPVDLIKVEADRVVSRANPGYRSDSADIIEYQIFASEAEMVAALESGEIHTLLSPKGITGENADRLSESETVSQLVSPTFGVRYLGFNLKREPMDQLPFRNAVALLMDVEDMAARLTGIPEAAHTLMPSANGAWFDAEAAAKIATRLPETLEARLAAAVEGLAGIGYSWTTPPAIVDGQIVAGQGLMVNGLKPAPLTILTPGDAYDPARNRYAEEIAQRIELLGYSVIPVATDFSTVVDLAFTPADDGRRHYDMVLLGWSLGNPAYPTFYKDLFGSTGAANNTGFASPAMDALIAEFDRASSVEEARGLVWEMESLLASEIPYIPLYPARIIEAYRSDQVSLSLSTNLGGIHASLGGFESVTPIP